MITTKVLQVFYNNESRTLYKGVASVYDGGRWMYNAESPIDRLTEKDAMLDAEYEKEQLLATI